MGYVFSETHPSHYWTHPRPDIQMTIFKLIRMAQEHDKAWRKLTSITLWNKWIEIYRPRGREGDKEREGERKGERGRNIDTQRPT